MNTRWLHRLMLRAASLLAPGHERAGWIEEWRSELWYIPPEGATRFCIGAFQDALWLRRNTLAPRQPGCVRLESPARCLVFLAMLAAASVVISICLLGPLQLRAKFWRLRTVDLPAGCFVMLLQTGLLLPVTRMAMGLTPSDSYPSPWPARLRRGLFFAAKIALVQPIMLCGCFVLVLLGPIVPVAPTLGICAAWILAFRWVLLDQRRRCPVCLRLLTNSVRIGTPSRTFLDWYGAESMCARGHGLLQVPETSASYSGTLHWMRLDSSWRSLFSQATGARQ